LITHCTIYDFLKKAVGSRLNSCKRAQNAPLEGGAFTPCVAKCLKGRMLCPSTAKGLRWSAMTEFSATSASNSRRNFAMSLSSRCNRILILSNFFRCSNNVVIFLCMPLAGSAHSQPPPSRSQNKSMTAGIAGREGARSAR
jgi:hypothetical protein